VQHWLVKSEPESYSWSQFLKDGKTAWTGVRNFAARNHLRAMKKGDLVGFYHSGEEKSVVGLACVTREFYPDPTGSAAVPAAKGRVPRPSDDWSCVDLTAVKALTKPVTLAQIKSDKVLKEMEIVRQSRLSVSPATREQFERLLKLADS
jgi:predicted RNA-binding protein with PUA-like domain